MNKNKRKLHNVTAVANTAVVATPNPNLIAQFAAFLEAQAKGTAVVAGTAVASKAKLVASTTKRTFDLGALSLTSKGESSGGRGKFAIGGKGKDALVIEAGGKSYDVFVTAYERA